MPVVYSITFAALALICAVLVFITQSKKPLGSRGQAIPLSPTEVAKKAMSKDDDDHHNGTDDSSDYIKFRNNYLLVYLCMMMADWLQGPYVYALYKSYGYGLEEIGILFVVGFLSSAVFGTVISSLADKYGRKKMAVLFSLIYTASCFTKFSSNFLVLLVGRLLGGIATSLLFSVFEAWMVGEHNKRGFSPELLSDTFSKATFGNGIVAIVSGLMADTSVYALGTLVAPFMLSAVFLVFGGTIVSKVWNENYGEEPASVNQGNDLTIWKGFQMILKDFKILHTGVIVSLFEGTMYTFVFLWGPVLEKDQAGEIPFGLIFATFMVCIMIGSMLYKIATQNGYTAEQLTQPILLLAIVAFSLQVFFNNHLVSFFAFNLFELCCGFYFPMAGVLRSRYVPEEARATIMNLFRVPLNLIVVIVLTNVSTWSHKLIFTLCSCLLGLALLSATALKLRSK